MQDPAYLTEENRTGLRMKEGAISKANTDQELPEGKIKSRRAKIALSHHSLSLLCILEPVTALPLSLF